MSKKYYLKVSLLEREEGQELEESNLINAHTAVMGTDKAFNEKLFGLLSRSLGAFQSVFELKD